MKILVDVDGVQADLAPRFLQALYRLTGQRYTPEQWTDWSPSKAGLCTDAMARLTFETIGDSVDLLPDVPGAVEGVRALRQAGHRLVALTSPLITPGWLHGRVRWLHTRGFGNEDIVLAWDKALVPGDVMIDDNADFANRWATKYPQGTCLLFDQPWNASALFMPNVRRVVGWDQVVQIVSRLGQRHSADCFGYPCERGELCR